MDRSAASKLLVEVIIGEDCLAPEQGRKVYQLATSSIARHGSVTFDFTGVIALASPFLNSSVGRLVGDLGADFCKKVHFAGLDDEMREDLDVVIQNARQYYSNPSINTVISKSQRELAEQR